MSEGRPDEARNERDGARRGRHGGHSVEKRTTAVLGLISGRATVESLVRRFGVRPGTIEGWGTDAPAGIEEAQRRGTGRTARAAAREQESRGLLDTVRDLSIDEALLNRGSTSAASPTTGAGEATAKAAGALFDVSRAAFDAARKTPAEGPPASRRRVWAVMRPNGELQGAHAPRPARRRRGQVVAPAPNRRLATDLMTVWTRRKGLVAVVPTVGGGGRSVLDVTATMLQESGPVLGRVDRALKAAVGDPASATEGVELRSDHGFQHTGADAAARTAHREDDQRRACSSSRSPRRPRTCSRRPRGTRSGR